MQRYVAMSVMNRCAKCHGDIPSGYRLKFNPVSAIELSKTANFDYNLWNPTQASNFGGTFDQFMRFSQKMPLYFFYTMVKKVTKTKTSS